MFSGERSMTESEWLACDYPSAMLEALSVRPDHGKVRLLACHWCLSSEMRRLLESQGATEFVAAGRRYVAGGASWDELAAAARTAPQGRVSGGPWRSPNPVRLAPAAQALRAVAALLADDPWEAAWGVAREAVNLLGPAACDMIRELFRNPCNPAVFNFRWRTADVLALAGGIDADQAFDRLPILADALTDAGCDSEDILAHCRSGGLHVRGCWAVDLILGKA
jgi:hypothetical protein